ncbi:MAG: primosomal protein N', partial [Muribaculaceae bacterium]|nr:primosomal protein N' [Muribaculaceae bacterium]
DDVEKAVSRLVALDLVKVSERAVERIGQRKISYVRPLFDISDKEAVQSAFAAAGRSERQQTMLLTLMAIWRESVAKEAPVAPVEDAVRRSTLTRTYIKALADKGIVAIEQRSVSRYDFSGKAEHTLPTLSKAQQTALDEIHNSFADHAITLLHGVTSCGKTEIYIHLIDRVLRDGNQALLLVPEIALTTQLTSRLQKVFGDRVIIYHSKFSDAQRKDIWLSLLRSNQPCVIVGARSSVFLPFARLGLVIVDEEHESSYKQSDPAPRYNGRDAAIVLAGMHGAKTLLGSATPSVETYYKAVTGKFGLVSLTERYGGGQLPPIEIIDLNKEYGRGATTGTFADHTVVEARKVLNAGHQVIFFHNRRGYSPMARCRLCAFIPRCDHCDVSLTYHRSPEQLVCHYCGAVYPMPSVCPSCHEPAIGVIGYGTERLEDNISRYFPGHSILRMDLDTTRNKNGYQQIIDSFSARKADILVGTQMVTKGLDFGRVSVVGVI